MKANRLGISVCLFLLAMNLFAEHVVSRHSRGTVTMDCGLPQNSRGFWRPALDHPWNEQSWSASPPLDNQIFLRADGTGTYRWVVHYEGQEDPRPLAIGTRVQGWRLGRAGDQNWFRLARANGSNSRWVQITAEDQAQPQLAHVNSDGSVVVTEWGPIRGADGEFRVASIVQPSFSTIPQTTRGC